MSQQGSGVLPLPGEAGHRIDRHQQDLVLCLLAGVRILEREAREEIDVDTELHLPGARRLEVRVPEYVLFRLPTHDLIGLVLGVVCRPQPAVPYDARSFSSSTP